MKPPMTGMTHTIWAVLDGDDDVQLFDEPPTMRKGYLRTRMIGFLPEPVFTAVFGAHGLEVWNPVPQTTGDGRSRYEDITEAVEVEYQSIDKAIPKW